MKSSLALLVLVAAASTGCMVGTEPDTTTAGADESTASTEQAFTESACPTLTPDAFLTVIGHNQEAIADSPKSYGTDSRCPNAYKVDVLVSGAATGSVYAYWQAPFPNTQASCVNAKVFQRLYEKVGASYVLRSATTSFPQWHTNRCDGLFVWTDLQNLGNGHDWRIITEGIGSDNKLRPVEVLLLSN